MRNLGSLRIVPIIHDRVTSSSSYFGDPPAIGIPRGIVGSAIAVVSLVPLDPSYGESVLELKTGKGAELEDESTLATIQAAADGETFVAVRERLELAGDRLGTHVRLEGEIAEGESYDLSIFLLLEETAPAGAPGGFASYAGGDPTPSGGGAITDATNYVSFENLFNAEVAFDNVDIPGETVDIVDEQFAPMGAPLGVVIQVFGTGPITGDAAADIAFDHSDDGGDTDPWVPIPDECWQFGSGLPPFHLTHAGPFVSPYNNSTPVTNALLFAQGVKRTYRARVSGTGTSGSRWVYVEAGYLGTA